MTTFFISLRGNSKRKCGFFSEGQLKDKTQRQLRGVDLAKVEVEKRISPLRGSQMREPLRSK
jgi:hypothetical protein